MDRTGVCQCMDFVESTLKAYRLKRRDLMEALLLCEEALLQMEERAPEGARLQVRIRRRLGIPQIRLEAPGEAIDLSTAMEPISLDHLSAESEQTIRGIMLRSYANSFKYRHVRNSSIFIITTGIPERVLATQTVLALLLAVIVGMLMRLLLPGETLDMLLQKLFSPIQTLFVSALSFVAAPAIFVSIACAMFCFEGYSDLGRSGKRVIVSYLATSLAATLAGLAAFRLIKPGRVGLMADQALEKTESFSASGILEGLVPGNIIEPFLSVNALQLMVMAMFIGGAVALCGSRVAGVKNLLLELDVLCGKLSSIVMMFIPVLVFCATVNIVLKADRAVYTAIFTLVATLLLGLIIVVFIYGLILFAGAGIRPLRFLKKYAPTMKSTFLKGSGVAAIPLTMRFCRRQLGIPKNIISYAIPLGATINMDGNCVCLTVISLFFCRICGIVLTGRELLLLIFLILVLSLGAPIAPGTIVLCTTTLMAQLGISPEAISLIIGINFILEMVLGMTNTLGDVVTALATAGSEGVLDRDRINQPDTTECRT